LVVLEIGKAKDLSVPVRSPFLWRSLQGVASTGHDDTANLDCSCAMQSNSRLTAIDNQHGFCLLAASFLFLAWINYSSTLKLEEPE
jgi:hypothetical protein